MNDTTGYSDNDYLMISGIQHYIFCRRQWSLIHIEHQWKDNIFTIEGDIIHEKCHDELFREKRKNLIVARGMRVYSSSMGVTGQCDVVEFHKCEDGAVLFGLDGRWLPTPVEYKRGREKADTSDMAQLCAQAICLEEMLCCEIEKGYIYYDDVHRREEVLFTEDLREGVKKTFREMHNFYRAGYVIKGKYNKKCDKCSLKDICLPVILKDKSVSEYYRRFLEE